MTCEALQSEILTLPDAREISATQREHVAACPACQAWWQQVRRIETLVEKLPAPASSGKAELIAELQGKGPVIRDLSQLRVRGSGFDRRKVYALAGLAASIAVVVGVVTLMSGPSGKTVQTQPAPPHPFLERVVQRNISLAKSTSPTDRLANLGLLAEDVRLEARDLARVASAEDLKALAGWYDKLVREGLMTQAEALPKLEPAARAALLRNLADRLTTAGDDADQMSRDVPQEARDSMRRMAETAKAGQQKLRQLAGGA